MHERLWFSTHYWSEEVSRLGGLNVAEKRRADILTREVGCLCCRQLGHFRQAQLHYIVRGHRLGHMDTIPLCPWHHMGSPFTGYTASETALYLGPSLARNKRQFVEEFGDERALLTQANELVAEFERGNAVYAKA